MFSPVVRSSQGRSYICGGISHILEADVRRGVGNHILKAAERRPNTQLHFYISSGGNAGLAAVLASESLNYPCTVVVPTSCKPYMISKLKVAGAHAVIQHGSSWREADNHLKEVMKEAQQQSEVKGIYVPPFDSEDIWDGASTMVEEWEKQLGVLEGKEKAAADVVICSIGGGGLFSGLCQGIEASSSKTQVVAVETKGADSLNQSVKAEYLVTLPAITSIATSLGATQVCSTALAYALEDNVSSVVVTDKEAVSACLKFAEEERMLVEPACGATLAIIYEDMLKKVVEDLKEDTKVVVVVCGGSTVGLDLLLKYKEEFGL
jgi:L-serine/L-threonine ammonia-lyase